MRKNVADAKFQGSFFAKLFPHNIDLYVPGEHEDFVNIAYRDKYLTIEQLLEIDCKIIDGVDLVIFFAPDKMQLSPGMQVEYDHAMTHGKRTYVYERLTHKVIADIYGELTQDYGV
jgi:hypothetical protein